MLNAKKIALLFWSFGHFCSFPLHPKKRGLTTRTLLYPPTRIPKPSTPNNDVTALQYVARFWVPKHRTVRHKHGSDKPALQFHDSESPEPSTDTPLNGREGGGGGCITAVELNPLTRSTASYARKQHLRQPLHEWYKVPNISILVFRIVAKFLKKKPSTPIQVYGFWDLDLSTYSVCAPGLKQCHYHRHPWCGRRPPWELGLGGTLGM